ncbi:MAG TPA: DUF4232 domain-containing protein [Actinocrinis sp.]|jgi:hypothetical protein
MRVRTSTVAACCAVAAALAAGGCASTNAGNAADGSSATPSADASSPSAQASAAASGDCQAANLTFALGASSTGSSQTTQAVDLTNSGSSACTMDGFPGVDLVGVADGQTTYTWSLVRQSASYSPVTLQPGGTAHFDLYYLPDTSGSGQFAVTKFVITPPNTYTQAQVTWSRNVELQDGATHPGTYIGPIVSGA